MNFNISITGLQDQSLWQAAENCLRIDYANTYNVTEPKGYSIKLEQSKNRPNYCFTVVKIILLATIAFPIAIAALIVKAVYRKKYNFEIFNQTNFHHFQLVSGSLEEKIKQFKLAFVDKYVNKKEKNILARVMTNANQTLPTSIQDQQMQLKAYLKSLKTYKSNINQIVEILYSALNGLVEKPPAQNRLEFAKIVYKQLSSFLRNRTPKKWIEEYRNQLNKDPYSLESTLYFLDVLKNPIDEIKKAHVSAIHLLKQLRKQIKLLTKSEKIKLKIDQDKQLKSLSSALVAKALKYLDLTWMHGTKGSTIESACGTCDKAMMPTGLLQKKRNIWPIIGSLFLGASGTGVNTHSLSGVNLPRADMSISYAKHTLDMDKEKTLYQELLHKNFVDLKDFLNQKGSFTKHVVAMRRVQRLDPSQFEKDKTLHKQLLQRIYCGLETQIFEKKPKEIFAWHDKVYSSELYSFLKGLEELEQILNQPKEETQQLSTDIIELTKVPIVVGSNNRYGFPACFSPREDLGEELRPGEMVFGNDLQVVFTDNSNTEKIRNLFNKYNLQAVQVEPLEVLETANKLDQTLGSYFYDIYSLRKWTAVV